MPKETSTQEISYPTSFDSIWTLPTPRPLDGEIPSWLREKCNPLWIGPDLPRPCLTTYSCPAPPKTSEPCTTMPPEVAYPPEERGASGCTYYTFTGIACTGCNTNYCNAEKACPLGYSTTTRASICATPRCGFMNPLPACPTKTPVYNSDPDPSSNTRRCDVTVNTGMPCGGCQTICTIPTAPPVPESLVDALLTGCGGEYITTTTEKLCYSICTIPSLPTLCQATVTPTNSITETWGCNVYVQTGAASCDKCLEYCVNEMGQQVIDGVARTDDGKI